MNEIADYLKNKWTKKVVFVLCLESSYEDGIWNMNQCLETSMSIIHLDECERALESLYPDTPSLHIGSWSYFPVGCFYHEDTKTVYFNEHETGDSPPTSVSYRMICIHNGKDFRFEKYNGHLVLFFFCLNLFDNVPLCQTLETQEYHKYQKSFCLSYFVNKTSLNTLTN